MRSHFGVARVAVSMKWTWFVLPFTLAACEPQARDSRLAPDTAQPSAAPTPHASEERGGLVASPEKLAGEYRVAGVDGEAVDLPYAITASIGTSRIHVVADCVNIAWEYRLVDGILATERASVEGCARGLQPIEAALAAALDGADRVVRTPANGYEFTGSGPSATLFSQ
jgi:hypothetical protein